MFLRNPSLILLISILRFTHVPDCSLHWSLLHPLHCSQCPSSLHFLFFFFLLFFSIFLIRHSKFYRPCFSLDISSCRGWINPACQLNHLLFSTSLACLDTSVDFSFILLRWCSNLCGVTLCFYNIRFPLPYTLSCAATSFLVKSSLCTGEPVLVTSSPKSAKSASVAPMFWLAGYLENPPA